MSSKKYKTIPEPIEGMPGGVPYIIGNEAAERFSFYGMKCILVIFMTQYLLGSNGELDVMDKTQATEYYHYFTSAVYFLPFAGALLCDVFLGKYKTILILSVVYCLGHLALGLDESRMGLLVGLGLISIGGGGIKPCVTAHVGDQFGRMNQHLLAKVYSWFYFSINLGSFTATLLTPWLLYKYGPRIAFSVPGVLMFLATVVFWMGRDKFIHVPRGGIAFVKECLSGDGLKAISKIFAVILGTSIFWSLFDQTGSSWVLQAEQMDRNWLGHEWLSSQIQAANPLLVMILIPIFSLWVYPFMGRFFEVTRLRKMTIGMFVMVVGFSIPAIAQESIDAGHTPTIAWQLLAYLIITASEVMVSITSLEFCYTQAPKKMKSFIMSLNLMSVSLGNLFTALVNRFIQNEDGSLALEGASYFWFFCGVMLAGAVVFGMIAFLYKEKTYIQDDDSD